MILQTSYNIEEAARFCQTTVWTIHRRIKEGKLFCFRAGGGRTFRIERNELLRFMTVNHIPIPSSISSKKKILLVDDDERVMRSLLRYFKTKSVYEVETASSGFRAGVLMESFKPHLVILDIMLGDINGYEVIKTIRKHPEQKATKVIAISGFVKDDEIKTLLSSGFDDYLAKPFKLSDLMHKVEELLEIPLMI
ncbi:MAG: response regulator [Candidatus Aureabacteria bacterium]|nr:response regulator [Candidatus Auribacterota bacterium]